MTNITANFRLVVVGQVWVSIATIAVCVVFSCMLAGPYSVNAIWDMVEAGHLAYRLPSTLLAAGNGCSEGVQ